jgi:hypothetical protein
VRGKRSAVALVVRALAALIALAATAGCSSDRSYVHVTVRLASGELTDIAQLIVLLNNADSNCDILYYPKVPVTRAPDGPFHLAPGAPLDFSVSFASSFEGALRLGVDAKNSAGNSVGYGEATKSIDPGHVLEMDVTLVPNALAPPVVNGCLGHEGPTCQTTEAESCGTGQSCHVTCNDDKGVSMCTAAGTRKAGESCQQAIGECEPGTQCFEYSCGATRPGVCLKFCKNDGECGGGTCTSVACKGTATGFGTCSLPCDPRTTAGDSCPAGLACFIFTGEIARCDCDSAQRSGGDGASCVDARDCMRGLLCVSTSMSMSSGAKTCRPICRLDTPADCKTGTCTKLTNPDYKTWGACLP